MDLTCRKVAALSTSYKIRGQSSFHSRVIYLSIWVLVFLERRFGFGFVVGTGTIQGRKEEMQIEMLAPVLLSRTGRHLQRYDKGCRLVVGCIPYRIHGPQIEDIEVLLITSQKSPRMMFPKGGWELDENIELAASRETLEEAGVIGLLGEKLGEWTFKSKSQEKFHMGSMFPLLVTKELDVWPEKDLRRRIWMPVIEAREACTQSWMKEALEAFVCQLSHPTTTDEGPLAALCRTQDLKLCVSTNY